MESKANFAVIGAFVLVTLFGFVAFLAYISGRQFDDDYDRYIVEYITPPRGISVGSEVRFNGLKMGEVTKTMLDKDDPGKVLVYIQVQADTPVHMDSYAQNEPLGLTGLSYIQLYAGPSGQRFHFDTLADGIPRIEGRGSTFDNLLGGSESVIDNVNLLLSRAVGILDPKAADDLHGVISNFNTITSKIAAVDMTNERVEEFMLAIEQAALDFSTASLAVDEAAKDVSKLLEGDGVNKMLEQAEHSLKAAELALNEYTLLATDGRALSEETRQIIEQFSNTGLQDLSLAMADLKTLIDSLNRVSENLERSPLEFIVGQEKEIMELPQ
jgi:phospholipid/cholesterol/gamma-HCH transport system substrate-binding protein